ncbi:MAG: SsrA-binding protein [Phototrophicales bacterium]|nr:MAG: SsrA-binding protein [Phototrophicales bacterium]
MTDGIKVITRNRKATHNYELLERYEAGIVLTGSEIKSIRAGRISLQEAYVIHRDGELWLMNAHIPEYKEAAKQSHHPLRPRKLLLHRREIDEIVEDLSIRGYTLIPTQVYLRNGRAKVEIALARGKKLHDKRQSLREKDDKRRMERALKDYRR